MNKNQPKEGGTPSLKTQLISWFLVPSLEEHPQSSILANNNVYYYI